MSDNNKQSTEQLALKQIKLSRTKNAERNIIAGAGNKMVTLLFPFLLRTVLIRTIGIEYAGLDGLFTSILQVLNLSELGFSSAVVYSMYRPIAENDGETICALLKFYRKAYRIVGFVILGLGLCVMPFLPHFIKGEYPSDINIYVLYTIFLLNTVISYLLFGYKNSVLNAHQRNDVISNILTVTRATMNIVQIAFLLITKNYYAYVIMMPIFTFANNILVAVETKKMYPQYVCKGSLSTEIKGDIKKNVSGLMISKVCVTTRNTFDSIFISAFLGLTTSAIYNNYYMIMNAVRGILAIFTSAIIAGIGNSIQTESVEKNYSDMRKFNFIYMWISTWCAICLLCLYQPFMELWMGNDKLLPFSSVCLMCLYFFVLKMGDIRAAYAEAAGIWWQQRWRAIIEAVANLILNFVFVRFWGVNGIIVATLIPLFIVNFLGGTQIVFKYYFKNGKAVEYVLIQMKNLLIAGIVSGVTLVCCRVITKSLFQNNLYILLLSFVICIFVPNIILFVINFWSKDFKSSYLWCKSLLWRRK